MINKRDQNRFQTVNLYDSDESTPTRKLNRNKKRRGKKEGYPTKNFLANSKGPHIQTIEKELGADYVRSF
jgi:hypothetical protein